MTKDSTPESGSESGPKPDPRIERRLRRSAARLAAVQALYQMDLTSASWRRVSLEFERNRLGDDMDGAAYRDFDITLFRETLRAAVERQDDIDPEVSAAMKEGWPLGRIDPILRALFRAAAAEMLTAPKTPPLVIVSEYIDVAKAFFEGKEAKFANGVLDALARRYRPEAMAPRG